MSSRLALAAPRYWPTWLALGVLRLFEPLPFAFLVALGRALGTLLRWLPLRFVRIARRNLELCFPELAPDERERILAQHFRSVGIALFETAITWWSSDERIRRLTQIEKTCGPRGTTFLVSTTSRASSQWGSSRNSRWAVSITTQSAAATSSALHGTVA